MDIMARARTEEDIVGGKEKERVMEWESGQSVHPWSYLWTVGWNLIHVPVSWNRFSWMLKVPQEGFRLHLTPGSVISLYPTTNKPWKVWRSCNHVPGKEVILVFRKATKKGWQIIFSYAQLLSFLFLTSLPMSAMMSILGIPKIHSYWCGMWCR